MSKNNLEINFKSLSAGGNITISPQITNNIHKSSGKAKEKYPDGTIGADIYAHGYIIYLAKKASEAQIKSGLKATPQKFYTQFEREHGLTPLYSRIEKLDVAISFLQQIIDKTKFARGMNHKFYHSFEEHKLIIDNPKGKSGLLK